LRAAATQTFLRWRCSLQSVICAPPCQRLLRLHTLCLPRHRQDPAALQLQKDGVVLEDAKKLADLKVENDDVVAMCYRNEGACC